MYTNVGYSCSSGYKDDLLVKVVALKLQSICPKSSHKLFEATRYYFDSCWSMYLHFLS